MWEGGGLLVYYGLFAGGSSCIHACSVGWSDVWPEHENVQGTDMAWRHALGPLLGCLSACVALHCLFCLLSPDFFIQRIRAGLDRA